MNNGINYTEIFSNDRWVMNGSPNRRTIQGYHHCARIGVLDYRKGAKNTDIAQLKSVDRKNLNLLSSGDAESKFGIGFEIEKTRFSRGAVRNTPLLAGYERDGSCGYEAVTNILPLLPSGQWRNKVFSMMHDANRVIDDSYSPSDLKCGGHITISCEGMSGTELMERVKKFSGIIYSIYRMRLKNGYCRFNITMNTDSDSWKGIRVPNPMKYQVALAKNGALEFRLPSRVQSVKQMMRRYELMYILLDYAVNKPNASINSFLKTVEPTIKLMYSGDTDKVEMIMNLAKSFQKFLNTEKVTDDIKPFLGFDDVNNAVMGYQR